MELVFVRHGESFGNMTGDYSTSGHDRLSPRGQAQAEALAERLGDVEVAAVYVSPLRRALETIAPWLLRRRLVAEVLPALAEGCHELSRTYAARVRDDLRPVRILDELAPCFRIPADACVPPDDESYDEGLARIGGAARLLVDRHGGSDVRILVVGHGHMGSRLMELLLGREPTGAFGHANTALSVLVEEPPSFRLALQNYLGPL